MGGGNEAANLVNLTAEEHYTAHQLLVKMHPGNHKLIWALSNMTGTTKRMGRPQNKRYAWVRKRFAAMVSEQSRGRKHTPEAKAKMKAARPLQVRRPHTDETKAKMSAASKGRKKSAAHVSNMAASKTGKKIGPHSAEWRRNISEGQRRTAHLRDYSHKQDPEYRARQSARMKEVWAERRGAQKRS